MRNPNQLKRVQRVLDMYVPVEQMTWYETAVEASPGGSTYLQVMEELIDILVRVYGARPGMI